MVLFPEIVGAQKKAICECECECVYACVYLVEKSIDGNVDFIF